jgi:hypothetical protein
MKNTVFIHAGNLLTDKNGQPNHDRCQNILNEIADLIMESKLYEDVDSINVELLGDPNIKFDVPKAVISHNSLDVHQWEFPTLQKIREYAKANPDDNILYLHTKGSSNGTQVPEFQWIEDVRAYQLHWNVTRYKDSLAYLKEYDVCGAELIYNPVRHYSQNFWWARASHINKLPHPMEYPLIYDLRHQCEFWIGLAEDSKYKSVFNLYDDYVNAVSFSKELYIKPNNL